jgi:hypothetical protein
MLEKKNRLGSRDKRRWGFRISDFGYRNKKIPATVWRGFFVLGARF